MDSIGSATLQAIQLLLSGDAELWQIIALSFRVSLTALLLALPLALACGFALAFWHFPGHWLLVTLNNTLLAVPTVVIGLLLFLLLSRSGPLGDLRLLFSQPAMIAGQFLMCLPILIAMSHTAYQSLSRHAWETTRTLGLSRLRSLWLITVEVRFALLAAVVTAFGRIIAEVGCAMMVGGNIAGYTRTITTAIALETSRGAYVQGIALGLVLLLLALGLNLLVGFCRGNSVQGASH
ncbi:ABC transporter permease [Marinospirillum alkaliphilum]|uniref:Tungstate transport system permease protein n=1 Tax=Marinospirillum alkaliphilum DSM 21637 TaxID=1122209 RepID=A0A1K1ZN14_9GAMM|nr:ABC transporter permease [Marinospirillum alkaliphilum]SFX75650.1 tungstate transport system permease protein [Marinospirillum alkaliphilum DSM 21637]